MLHEQIAQVAHDAIRSYCKVLGDHSLPEWKYTQQWQKESGLVGVKFVIDNPDASPKAIHDTWMNQKVSDGWSYGEVRNSDLKLHPCIVPFDQLSVEDQAKDKLFYAVVASLI